MDYRIKLLGQIRMKIMAEAFGFRAINYSNRAFQMLFAQDRCCGIVLAKVQQKLRQLGLVKEPLVTFSMRGADLLSLRPALPFAGGGDGSAMGGETDEECGVAIFFAHQLTDVQ